MSKIVLFVARLPLAPLLLVLGVATSCIRPQAASFAEDRARRPACRGLVNATGQPLDAAIRWDVPVDSASRKALSLDCSTVGPAVYEPPSAADRAADPADRLVLASWNMHVGGGDLAGFVSDLRAGRLTDGVPVDDFVLMLQEAFRGGGAVPDVVPAGAAVPDRISARPPDGRRQDVVLTARALGLSVFYLPSMRNGAEGGELSEDRGNAILSTRPLSSFAGIELPHTRQRRVAVSAFVEGVDSNGRPWNIRVVSSHLNASSSVKYLWMLSSVVRARQARHLVEALGADRAPAVMGSDLNTWSGGSREPAYREVRRAFPDEAAHADGLWGGLLKLDYVFFRLPEEWRAHARTVRDRFGSDHEPMVGIVEFNRTS